MKQNPNGYSPPLNLSSIGTRMCCCDSIVVVLPGAVGTGGGDLRDKKNHTITVTACTWVCLTSPLLASVVHRHHRVPSSPHPCIHCIISSRLVVDFQGQESCFFLFSFCLFVWFPYPFCKDGRISVRHVRHASSLFGQNPFLCKYVHF